MSLDYCRADKRVAFTREGDLSNPGQCLSERGQRPRVNRRHGHGKWRPEPESNRRARICSPLRNHSAIGPGSEGGLCGELGAWVKPSRATFFSRQPTRAFDQWWLARSQAADMTALEHQVYYRHITAMTVQTPIPDFAAARLARK